MKCEILFWSKRYSQCYVELLQFIAQSVSNTPLLFAMVKSVVKTVKVPVVEVAELTNPVVCGSIENESVLCLTSDPTT